jgi:hypothetical protein
MNKHSGVFSLRPNVKGVDELRNKILDRPHLDPSPYGSLRKRIEEEVQNRTVVYSEEIFTSSMGSVRCDRQEVAMNLANVFQKDGLDPKILCTVRNQESIIVSMYTFNYHMYRQLGMGGVNELVQKGVEEQDGTSARIMRQFRYYETIRHYEHAFGKENVELLTYEQLSEDPDSFLRALSEMLGIDASESLDLMKEAIWKNTTKSTDDGSYTAPSKLYDVLGQLKARYVPSLPSLREFELGKRLVDFIRGQGEDIRLSDESVRRIREYYREDNRKIANTLGVSLERFGYPV